MNECRKSISLACRFAIIFACAGTAFAADPLPTPLRNAHAHNDYAHARPLFDALDQGFCSVEADVFLVDGQLLVGHTRFELKPERTLQKLYLDPLRERAKVHGGKIYPNGPPFHLLIDVKTDAKPTCAAVNDVLSKYADLFTSVSNGKVETKAITAVISGNRDIAGITALPKRFAGIDGRPGDLNSDVPAHLIPWISDSWKSHFKWDGNGSMPADEKQKLTDIVAKAHKRGRLVRFWATPEKVAVWQELRAAGVDLINTDKLVELRDFLQVKPAQPGARPR